MKTKAMDWLSKDLAIDLGTANTLVFSKERGIVVNEPSVIAMHRNAQGETIVLDVGSEAKAMLGRTPYTISAIRPMQGGVIADFDATQNMLKHFIFKAKDRYQFVRPRIVVCIPFGSTQVEKRAVKESMQTVGARQVFLIEEPMAAAIGAGLPITEPSGSMVVDIGGGTTEVAVISLGGIVYSKSIRVAGNRFDEVILNFIKRKHSISIGESTAEKIKIQIGNAYPLETDRTYVVRGRDLVLGAPKTVEITSEEVREALFDSVMTIVDTIKTALECTPDELAADIVNNGLILTGGGSLLENLDILIQEQTGLPVALAEDPLTCVVRGAGHVLGNSDLLRQISVV